MAANNSPGCDLNGLESLSAAEQKALLHLLAKSVITLPQAQQVLAKRQQHKSPLRDILGAFGYVHRRHYATNLAEATRTAYVSELIGSDAFSVDKAFVKRFAPAHLMRHLFCPIQQMDDLIIVLAADPTEPEIERLVHQVAPGAEVVALVGTELDVTRLVDAVFQSWLTFQAVDDLRMRRPDESASQVFTLPQIVGLAALSLALVAGLVWNPWDTLRLLIWGISIFYALSIVYKLALSLFGLWERDTAASADDDISVLNDADLPVYSILVPVYKEPEVVPTLLAALSRMDYPTEKLDVLLLMEEDDQQTIAAARAAQPPGFFRFIYIPNSKPRTKPKACNYGLHFCRGEFVTIYDAEDIPEPDQLKKAVLAFRNGPPSLVCVQAALNYFNSKENYLTKMFTLEYSYWFDYMLPGLDRLRLPIPLGGTSNHFRLDLLRELGGWDPFNVTEDADLGIRASARGYTVGVINSTTYEEANKALKNWIRQRSRWIKGYMQTWLVHNRRPLHLLRRIGLKNWLSYQFFVGGTCLTFLSNPLLWLLYFVWLIFRPAWTGLLFNDWVIYLTAFNFLIGNMLGIYLNMLAVFRRRLFHLTPYALTNPFYWWLHSVAAYMGLWQLVTKPFYWEKTTHGLTKVKGHELLHAATGKASHGS